MRGTGWEPKTTEGRSTKKTRQNKAKKGFKREDTHLAFGTAEEEELI